MLGPIREPAPAFEAVRMGLAEGVPAAVARRIGERMLSAAEDRIRHGSAGRRGAVRSVAAVLALKLVAFVVFAAFVGAVWWFTMRFIQTTLAPPGPRITVPAAAPATQAMQTTRATVSSAGDPCHEAIDVPSGTYIDHCAPRRPSRPSAAQAREQQRRADDAAQVIVESTPAL